MTRYAVVNIAERKIEREWDGFPQALDLPNRKRIVSPVGPEHLGRELDGYRFVEIQRVNWDRPGEYHRLDDTQIDLTAKKLTLERSWTAWTQNEIDADRANLRNEDIADFLGKPIARLLFLMAKELPRPDLTPAQFETWVRANWP